MPRISVIIPTYNRVDFIGEAIQSVLDQTYPDFELIVIDDASTDDTAQVVTGFNDERVKYVYQDNAGASAARNAGIAVAQGEFLSFLDSDDCMLPNNLESLVTLLDERPEVSVAYGWHYLMDQDGQPLMIEDPKIEGDGFVEHIPTVSPWPGVSLRPSGPTMEGQIFSRLVLEETMMIGSALFRRKCVETVGGFNPNTAYTEHWEFYLRVAGTGYTYACCKKPVMMLRIHHANSFGTNFEEMLARRIDVLKRLFADLTMESVSEEVRQQAFYKAYIDTALALYMYYDNLDQGSECLNKALDYASLQAKDMEKISRFIIERSFHSDIEDPFKFAGDFFTPIRLTSEIRHMRRRVLDQIMVELSEKMTQSALAPEIKDPLGFARDLFKPIHSTAEVRRLQGKVLGQINAELAFRHYQSEELNQVWRHALGAVIHDPSWLRNRGLARIALDGLVGWFRYS